MKTIHKLSCLMALSLLVTAGQYAVSAGLVQNPSFESNYNDSWPHYGLVDLWEGGSGVNEGSGPFHNTGTPIPDQSRVAFKQGNGTLGQDISGLTPGSPYWVQFYYDARIGSGKVDISVSFNGVEVGKIANVAPAKNKNLPYYSASFPFTPDVDAGKLLFTITVTGDSSVLYDAVTIVPRDTNNVTVFNPSFEASGDVAGDGVLPNGPAGWQSTGTCGINITDGTGAQANNGTPSDQDHVAFLNGESSLSQVINNLIPGKPYQIKFAYNARTGNTPHLQVKVGDTVAFKENVTAVGGANAYRKKTVNFTAADFSAKITLAQTATGDQTLLLDDVMVIGETAKPLPPLSVSPSVAEISPGQAITITVTVPNELVIARDVDLKFRSLSPQVAKLTGADSDGVVTLHFAKGGANAKTMEMVGLARGSALLDVVESAGLLVQDTLTAWVVTSFVKNPSFEGSGVPAGVGYGEILGWTGGSGLNSAAGPFLDNGVVPDQKQVGFIQGSKTLSQQITGLTPGENYWLQFYYNARAFGTGWNLDLSVKLGGQELTKITNIQAVGEAVPFNFVNVMFKPTAASGLLEFTTTVQGDATLLLDAINIVQRDPVDVIVKNPSFEASGTIIPGVGYLQPGPISGWEFQASGFGVNVPGRDPFSDNGVNPDQDAVLFMQNAGSMSQTLTGLTAGKKYTVVFWVNPRNCCTGVIETTLRVSWNDTVLLEEVVQPVGGANPYLVKQVVVTADGTEGVLKLEHAPEAGTDRSIVFDNVRVFPGEQLPPIILTQPQGAARTVKGDNISMSVVAMGAEPLTYQWQFNGKDLPGKTSATLDLTAVTPEQSGQYSAVVRNSIGSKSSQPATISVYDKVPGAFNTGVAANGSLVAAGALDPHYTTVENPNDANSTKAYVVADPPDNWLANTENALWIGPVANSQAEPLAANGFYRYRLTFNLTGYDSADTFITGNAVAAQGMDDIYLNDVVAPGNRHGGTAAFYPFTITSGFKAGNNTLEFRVYSTSTPQPTGVLVSDLMIGSKVKASAPNLTLVRQGASVIITFDGTLQAADKVEGSYQDINATSPYTVNAATGTKFYRAKQ